MAVDITTQDGIVVDRHLTGIPEQDYCGALRAVSSRQKLGSACRHAG